jgi:5-methylcytosine-specific restriction protein B
MEVRLPYKDDDGEDVYFGVPNNVYILGTMNTADRSLVQLDAALRRRFRFIEMMPDYDVIENEKIASLLKEINGRIIEHIDREHQIGHSYFTKVKNLNDLVEAFKYEIIPLLQEYFYEDYDGIREVLNSQIIEVGENKKSYKINLPKDKDMSGNMSSYKDVFTKILSSKDNSETVSGLTNGKDEEL